MRRRETDPLEKVTLNLFKGDKGRLQDLHGRLGYGKVTRELVRRHIIMAEEEAENRVPTPEITGGNDVGNQ